MIAHLREREKNLEPFGWNPEDAEWVAMVCLHSGVFTRLQYMDYFNTYHNRASRFVQSLLDLRLAVDEEIPVISTREPHPGLSDHPQEHLPGAGRFPTSGTGDFADPGVYLRRLLSLDYVIEHPELEWLPTEEEKVWYCEDIGIRKDRLPKRIYTGAAGASPGISP